jgi:DNA-binding NarL/FixJ family response regulator
VRRLRVEQHDSGNLAGIRSREETHVHPARGMASEDIWTVVARRREERMQVAGDGRAVLRADCGLDLTDRERAVLALMAEGRSNQAIGDRLGMARKTVEAHIANIFSKLELEPAADDHRRLLAVLAHLRGSGRDASGES